MVQSLCHWRYYLLPKEFVLYYGHQALRYFYSQSKLSSRHVKWVEFLRDYTFVLKYRAGINNKTIDALSRAIIILHFMQNSVIGFKRIKDEYPQCPKFGIIYKECLDNLM